MPCLITSGLAQDYKIGEKYELKTEFDERVIGSFYICGVIKDDMLFSPTYGFDYDTLHIIAYDPEGKIDKRNELHFDVWNAVGAEDFSERYSDYIEQLALQPFDYFYSSRNELEHERIMPYVLLMIVFSALSLTGLIAYSIASSIQLRHQTALFLLVGAKKRQLVLISFLRIFMIVTVPAAMSFISTAYMRTTDIGQTTLLSLQGQLIAISLCFGVMFLSSLVSVIGIGQPT